MRSHANILLNWQKQGIWWADLLIWKLHISLELLDLKESCRHLIGVCWLWGRGGLPEICEPCCEASLPFVLSTVVAFSHGQKLCATKGCQTAVNQTSSFTEFGVR